jgi:hypothetical protein
VKRTVTTREYDEHGRVTKEIVTEEVVTEEVDPGPWTLNPTWTSPNITITTRSASTEDIKKFGDALVRQMRQARAR